jgi:glycosyltransferase involved in cell wall biosynthesis
MQKRKVTVCVPCYGRPQRTLRALDCLMEQDFVGWEAFFVGDNCPDFQKLIDDGTLNKYASVAKDSGNLLIFHNLGKHYGSWGYEVRNRIIRVAEGDYFVFMDNDDMIKPNHLSNYYNAINNTQCDFVYFNTLISVMYDNGEKLEQIRNAELKFGSIGHQELIVKTSFLKYMPPQKPFYGHDWELVENMIKFGKYEKSNAEPTYIFKGVGDLRKDDID